MEYEKYFAGCASRRDNHEYFYSLEDIKRTFKNNLCFYGRYPEVLAGCMGDTFYMAKFKTEKELFVFRDFVGRRVGDVIKTPKTSKKKENKGPISDTHIDAA